MLQLQAFLFTICLHERSIMQDKSVGLPPFYVFWKAVFQSFVQNSTSCFILWSCITEEHYASDPALTRKGGPFYPVLAESTIELDTTLHVVCIDGHLPFLRNRD